ncbi:MAG: SDR family NAD(P)-dependent oxidoreductase, partial [Clostridiaceae bacterium]|nr:SDR family NAD(P)-dependent oxidoreductase [Clostridiaceae bacterium]
MDPKVNSTYINSINQAGKNLAGKTVVISGATSGIGLATAKEMAGYGAFVIGVGRSEQRCRLAEEEIRKSHVNAKITYIVADLSLLREVRKLSERIKEIVHNEGKDCIDVLVNNAGTFSSWYISTEEGFELQFAVNYLAPFLLTNQLLPLLKAAPTGRIINLSSGSHYRTKIRWNDIMMRKHYNCLMVYKQTKLANVLFTAELNRRLRKDSRNCANIYKSNDTGVNSIVCAFAVDPGLVNTQIGLKGTTGIAKWIWKKRSRKG